MIINHRSREKREISFKFFSLKTLLHCLWYFAPISTMVFLSTTQIMQDAKKISIEAMATKNVVDRFSQYFVYISSAVHALHPFLIGAGLPKISELALANDLKFPKNGFLILLASFFLLALHASGRSNSTSYHLKLMSLKGAYWTLQLVFPRLKESHSMTEIVLVLGLSNLASLPIILHHFLCLLAFITWVNKLRTDWQNI